MRFPNTRRNEYPMCPTRKDGACSNGFKRAYHVHVVRVSKPMTELQVARRAPLVVFPSKLGFQ